MRVQLREIVVEQHPNSRGALWIVRSSRAGIGGQNTGPERGQDRGAAGHVEVHVDAVAANW
jgi:hypothetical protein